MEGASKEGMQTNELLAELKLIANRLAQVTQDNELPTDAESQILGEIDSLNELIVKVQTA
jgi:hypothetical protein